MKFADKPDAPSQSAGALMAAYYIGRLDGRTPGSDVGGLMAKEMGKMVPADYEAQTKRRGAALTERAKQVALISKNLQARTKKSGAN